MGMTIVARGRDHMINTPPQILIYQALGAKVPDFAHLPMMLAPNGEKLSKRHGAVSVTEYRDKGYSPMAVLNYLARFGWSHGDQEVFSRQELIDAFSWEACGRGDGKTRRRIAIGLWRVRCHRESSSIWKTRRALCFQLQETFAATSASPSMRSGRKGILFRSTVIGPSL
jgi:hypothetical protein